MFSSVPAAITGITRMAWLKQHLLLTVQEAEKPSSSTSRLSGEALPPGPQLGVFSLCPHLAEREWETGSPFHKGTILTHQDFAFMPNYLLKAPPSNAITLAVKISTQEFWVGTSIQPIAVCVKHLECCWQILNVIYLYLQLLLFVSIYLTTFVSRVFSLIKKLLWT